MYLTYLLLDESTQVDTTHILQILVEQRLGLTSNTNFEIGVTSNSSEETLKFELCIVLKDEGYYEVDGLDDFTPPFNLCMTVDGAADGVRNLYLCMVDSLRFCCPRPAQDFRDKCVSLGSRILLWNAA